MASTLQSYNLGRSSETSSCYSPCLSGLDTRLEFDDDKNYRQAATAGEVSRGAKFLTDAEHTVYCRRLPVRYAAKSAGPKPEVCGVCGGPATPGNLLQAAHRIPFNTGIIQYRLTPDWLDRPENLVWAHRQVCNKKVEMSVEQIEATVRARDSSCVS